jgi:hypothetical protein
MAGKIAGHPKFLHQNNWRQRRRRLVDNFNKADSMLLMERINGA